jgi:uncharacterized spore protein YtfJ
MQITDVVNETRSVMKASEVFGTPVEKNGVTVIPAAKIMGGAGGGGDQHQPQAGGLGFGVMSQPTGAFVIKGNEVTWQPAFDLNRAVLMCQVIAIVALLTARTIVKAVARRR